MLTGVCADSSANMKDGWLSADCCRDGVSKPGVPALLNGLEKLKDGLGNGADESEPTEGDRAKCGDKIGGTENALLLEDSFRGGRELKDDPKTDSSSVGSSGEDRILEDRFENMGRGGANALSKEPFFVNFSGDCDSG
jgi:hypothetical protein